MIAYFTLAAMFFGAITYWGATDILEAEQERRQINLLVTLFICLCGVMFVWSVGLLAWQFL